MFITAFLAHTVLFSHLHLLFHHSAKNTSSASLHVRSHQTPEVGVFPRDRDAQWDLPGEIPFAVALWPPMEFLFIPLLSFYF